MAVGISVSSLNSSSPTSIWTLFNQLQLLLLFILINSYIPTSVKEYIESFSVFLFNFSFIPSHDIPGLGHFAEWLDTEAANEDLQRLGVDSKSAFSNTVPLLFMIIIAAIFHIIIRVIPKSKNTEETRKGKFLRFWNVVKRKVLDFFIYIFYLRLILQAHQGLLVSSVSELDSFPTTSAAAIISLI